MRRYRFFCAVLTLAGGLVACDWDDAERRARCDRDASLPGCGGVADAGFDAGSPDAGAEDSGTPDAGPRDGGADDAGSRSVFFPSTGPGFFDPIGLYPARDGGVWVVGNVSDRGLVQLRDVNGALVHDFSFDGSVVSAYGNGDVYPALAVLREGTDAIRRVWLVNEDGSEVMPVEHEGTDISMYVHNGTHLISVWNTQGNGLSQTIYDLSLTAMGGPAASSCSVQFLDLQVAPPNRSGPVVIPFVASNCDGLGAAVGITAHDAGAQTITPDGTRGTVDAGRIDRVGLSSLGDFRFVTQRDFGNLEIRDGVFSLGTLNAVNPRYLGAASGIRAGDVSDVYVTFRASGEVSDAQAPSPSVLCTCPAASVARVSPFTVAPLGNAADVRLPVLHSADNVWVLWAPTTGGLQLSNFTPDLLPR